MTRAAVIGAIASRLGGTGASAADNRRRNTRAGLLSGLAVDLVAVGLLANWDHIYGPW